jgi:ribosomal peptide maturation radical SAM protein 1
VIAELADAIVARGYRFVGASTTFEQTASSYALLRAVKERDPSIVTLLGGANCELGMADGVLTLGDAVDHVFSGESEGAFLRFLHGERLPRRVDGEPLRDMESLPEVRYDEYFRQIDRWLPELNDVPLWLTYESSRGCWWGEKRHCTFCGLNGSGMAFRQKSPEKVLGEIRRLVALSPTNRLNITDNIMPWSYHKTLLPRLAAEGPKIHAFYEMKSNLTLPQVKGLHDAGILAIQAGIEALSSDLLRLMRKGVTARQNLATMRYARALGMGVKWNLLYGFPGDDAAWYGETLALLRQIRHLTPPHALGHMSIERFSPYFEQPASFGIRSMEPMPAYFDAFPPHADVRSLAYHFVADYDSGSEADPALMDAIRDEIAAWREAWAAPPERRPLLWVAPAGSRWALYDTRGLGGPQMVWLSEAQAAAVLVGGPIEKVPVARWAISRGYAFETDGWCVPLALAPYEVLHSFEEKFRHLAPEADLQLLQYG